MLGTLVIIFLGGIAIDVLQTRYVAYVAAGHRLRAASISGLITFGSLMLWGTLLREAELLGMAGAGTLAVGAALGTLIGFWRRSQRTMGDAAPAAEPEGTSCRSEMAVGRGRPRLGGRRERSVRTPRVVRSWPRVQPQPATEFAE